VKDDIPLITTDEFIGQLKDFVTSINTKTSNIIMMTQVNHEKSKPKIKKNKLIKVPYPHPNHQICNMQESNSFES